jgi:hypothetical protein
VKEVNLMAALPNNDEYAKIVDIIRHWSATRRFRLVQDVLQTLDPVQQSTPSRPPTLDRALGMVHTAHPPTDKEVKQILEEHRQEKYGR